MPELNVHTLTEGAKIEEEAEDLWQKSKQIGEQYYES
jgi:hypothetical protein